MIEKRRHRGQPQDMEAKYKATYDRVARLIGMGSSRGVNVLGLLSTSTQDIQKRLGVSFSEVVLVERDENIYKDILKQERHKPGKYSMWPLLGELRFLTKEEGSRGRPPDEIDRILEIRDRFQNLIDFIDIDTCYCIGNRKAWDFVPSLIKHFATSGCVVHINGIVSTSRKPQFRLTETECDEVVNEMIRNFKVKSKTTQSYTTKASNNNTTVMRSTVFTV